MLYKIPAVSECLADENTYFIVSPKDIVEARQRDEDDHISWLIERQMFEVGLGASFIKHLLSCFSSFFPGAHR